MPSRADVWPVALHEAGHALAVARCARKIVAAEIYPDKIDRGTGCAGEVKWQSPVGIDNRLIDVLVHLAGPAAEVVYSFGCDGGEDDFAVAEAILSRLPQIEFIVVWSAAQKLIRREERLISAIAEALAVPPFRLEQWQLAELMCNPEFSA